MNLEDILKSASYKIWDEMEPVIDNKDFHVHQVSEPGLTSMALKKIVNSGCKQILRAKMIPGSTGK
ncbi:MAG: hypothetical protein IPK08_11890 [Bacteroidetes bacterium]|nr:hypothetical protein [Bacteroidota bacterium]